MATSLKNRFEALDSLRGICALLVICYHVRIPLSFTEAAFFRNGKYFVEFFFVLSGFVMLHTYGSTRFTREKFRDYLVSRIFRLWPMHLLMIIAVLGIEIVKLYIAQKGLAFNNPAFTDSAHPKELLPNLLLLHAWLPNTRTMSWNSVSWSISVEFYMYVILGVLLILAAKTRHMLFGVIMIISFYLLFINNTFFLKLEVLRGLSCFFGGCLCYLVYQKLAVEKPMYGLFTFLESLLVVLIVMTLSASLEMKGIVASLLFCVAVIVFAMEKGALSQLFKAQPFTYLGKLSYSMYMVHYVFWLNFIGIAMIITKFTGVSLTTTVPFDGKMIRLVTTHHIWSDNLLILSVIAIVILISHFTYHYVEKKGIEMGKRFRTPKPAPVPVISK